MPAKLDAISSQLFVPPAMKCRQLARAVMDSLEADEDATR
jgi:hypothetical protein